MRHLNAAAGRLFWAIGKAPPQTAVGAVRSKALSGGSVVIEADDEPAPEWVDADPEGRPYWVDVETNEVRRRSSSPPGSTVLFSGPEKRSLQIAGGRVYWTAATGALFSAPITDTNPFRKELEGPYRLEGFRVEGTTIYLVTFEAGELSVWRRVESGDAPLLLGKVAAKAANYAGNPFGGAHVLVDQSYVYFADPGTVDVGQAVPESAGDGAVYRVAK